MVKIKFKISHFRKDRSKPSNFDATISPYNQRLLDSMFKKWKED